LPRIGGQSTGQVAAPRQTPPPRQPPPVAHPLSGFNAVTPRTTSGLVSALSEAAADRTCRAIGIPLSHRLLNSLRAQTKQRRLMPTCAAMQEPCRSHAGAINQDLKRQPWRALVATLAGKALRRNRGSSRPATARRQFPPSEEPARKT
jgi:hypothetical protein